MTRQVLDRPASQITAGCAGIFESDELLVQLGVAHRKIWPGRIVLNEAELYLACRCRLCVRRERQYERDGRDGPQKGSEHGTVTN
ncbi:MAG TPA: hypothetical protein VGH77_05635 [Streptosporangiaceae bacterium]